MKKLFLLSLASFALISCKKEIYGCTNINAENYSAIATKDDGSCYILEPTSVSSQVTISSWTQNLNDWKTIIPYSAITSDVLENGSAVVYKEDGNNVWSSLPLTYYPSTSYSTSYQVSITVSQVIITVSNSDGNLPANPGEITFKITVIN